MSFIAVMSNTSPNKTILHNIKSNKQRMYILATDMQKNHEF